MDGIVFTWQRNMKARKEFVQDHDKKIELVRKILNARSDSKAIVFTGTIKLAEKVKIGHIVHSEKTKKKNRMTIEEFNKEKKGVIINGKMLKEGADIPGLNLAIIANRTSSLTDKVQTIGRVIRKEEGKIAEVFNLVIKGTVDEKWFENSSQNTDYIEINESELEDVLCGQEINRLEKEGKEIDPIFRN